LTSVFFTADMSEKRCDEDIQSKEVIQQEPHPGFFSTAEGSSYRESPMKTIQTSCPYQNRVQQSKSLFSNFVQPTTNLPSL
jgi:hypothetical protein